MRTQKFKYFKTPAIIQAKRLSLIIPEFAYSAQLWAGVSDILGGFSLGNDYIFSLKRPIRAFGQGFVLAVRFTEDGQQLRYVLWEDEDAVLFYPVYAGEPIGVDAYIEVWSTNTTDAPENPSAKTLYSSILAFPQGACCACCSEVVAEQNLSLEVITPCNPYSYCLPLCE